MSDNISAQELFKSGLTREQFIEKYSELQKTDKTKDSSIFSENFANSLGQIFDTLNTNGNDTLDENEYQRRDLYRQKASAFAEMFAPVNPVEKLNDTKQQINNILNGGEDTWESLK